MASEPYQDMNVTQLMHCPFNVRTDPGDLSDLAASIDQLGVLQPLLVRPAADGEHYEVVAGSRRWKACQQIGRRTVPVIVRQLTDREALEISLTENVQQQTLDPIERAGGLRRLIDDYSQEMPRTDAIERAGERVGLKRTAVQESLALLRTTESVKQMVRQRRVPQRVAARLTAFEPERQDEIARVVETADITRDSALKVVQRAHSQPDIPAQQLVLEVQEEELAEINISVTFSGKLYQALVERRRENRDPSIQETIRQACRAYLNMLDD